MSIELNSDSYAIRNYELTPEGYLKFWMVGGIPNKILNYSDGRKETINRDALFNENSLSSAVGKPITHNHPPRPVNSKNYRDYSKGVALQEYSEDETTGGLVLAGIIHDHDAVKSVTEGRCKYVSASYLAEKTENNDGVLNQTNRQYNHFAILSDEYSPRAGEDSKIIILDDTTTTPETMPQIDGIDMTPSMPDIAERVELLTTWKTILEENSLAIDYQSDSNSIKRQILSIYYPDNTIKSLNDDAVLKGFWLNFVSNNDTKENDKKIPTKIPLNFDSAVQDARTKYIAKMQGGK